MVQIIKGGVEEQQAKERIGYTMGKNLSDTLMNYGANKALSNVLKDEKLKNAPSSEKMGALQLALEPYGQKGMELLQNRIQVEQMEQQEQEQAVLGKINAGKEINEKDWAKVSPQNQIKAAELMQKKQGAKSIREAMIKAGVPQETADIYEKLYQNSPTGGQTDIIKAANDQIRRHKMGRGEIGSENKQSEETTISIPGTGLAPMPLKLPPEPEEIGVTSADKIKREDKRQAINTPKYDEAIDRLHMADDDFKDFEYMEELNEKIGALPEGFEKWNVDWATGDLRIPAAATPETQAYLKTLARQLSRAKNDFPGRVTNFDLEQFKRKFPTLANSPEGRGLILQQLKTANRIAFLRDETMKKAYDHYGSSADPMFVRKVADENYRSMKGRLEEHLKRLNESADSMAPESAEESANVENWEDLWK